MFIASTVSLIVFLLSTIHSGKKVQQMRMFDVKACWSQAGVGTSFVLEERTENNKGFNIVFDLGCTPVFDQSIKSNTVILSHGHIDHFGGIFSHARAHRMKCGKSSTPTYYVPEELAPKLEKARDLFLDIDATHCSHEITDAGAGVTRTEGHADMKIVGVKAGVEVELKQVKVRNGVRYYLRPFQVSHGGHPALGYCIVSKTTTSSLKPEYRGVEGKKLGELARSGIKIKEVKETERAEVLYSGDTCVDGLMNIDNGYSDLHGNSAMSLKYLQQGFTSPLILCELTFLDPNDAELAKQRGHMNIKDIHQILQSHDFDFGDTTVGNSGCDERRKIIFYHISTRHAPLKRIMECMCKQLDTSVLDISEVAVSSFLFPNSTYEEEVQQNGCLSIRDYTKKYLTTSAKNDE